MSEIRLIDANALKEALSQTPYNDYDDLTRTENLIDNAPTVAVDNYAMGYQDGVRQVLSERPQGEITDEDIQNAIKQGYNDGYEMAKAKYERPKGEWVSGKDSCSHLWFCSECKMSVPKNDSCKPNYCWFCGADMRGGAE